MKTIKLLFSIFMLSATIGHSQNSAMTYNLRYATDRDMENSWENRKEELVELIKVYNPDFLGTQEGLKHQLNYIDENISSYSYTGVARDNGDTAGEYTAIFYNTNKYKILESNTFWLSDTPDRPSFSWKANFKRICTYALFENRTSGDSIYVFNTHFDHESELSRRNSAKLILQKIDEFGINNNKIILMGDLNCEPDSEPVKLLESQLNDPMKHLKLKGPKGTFNAFDASMTPQKRIDYIFTRNIVATEFIHIEKRRKNNLWPSDHLPVLIKYE